MNKIINFALIASVGALGFLADGGLDIVDLLTIVFIMLKRNGVMP